MERGGTSALVSLGDANREVGERSSCFHSPFERWLHCVVQSESRSRHPKSDTEPRESQDHVGFTSCPFRFFAFPRCLSFQPIPRLPGLPAFFFFLLSPAVSVKGGVALVRAQHPICRVPFNTAAAFFKKTTQSETRRELMQKLLNWLCQSLNWRHILQRSSSGSRNTELKDGRPK